MKTEPEIKYCLKAHYDDWFAKWIDPEEHNVQVTGNWQWVYTGRGKWIEFEVEYDCIWKIEKVFKLFWLFPIPYMGLGKTRRKVWITEGDYSVTTVEEHTCENNV